MHERHFKSHKVHGLPSTVIASKQFEAQDI